MDSPSKEVWLEWIDEDMDGNVENAFKFISMTDMSMSHGSFVHCLGLSTMPTLKSFVACLRKKGERYPCLGLLERFGSTNVLNVNRCSCNFGILCARLAAKPLYCQRVLRKITH